MRSSGVRFLDLLRLRQYRASLGANSFRPVSCSADCRCGGRGAAAYQLAPTPPGPSSASSASRRGPRTLCPQRCVSGCAGPRHAGAARSTSMAGAAPPAHRPRGPAPDSPRTLKSPITALRFTGRADDQSKMDACNSIAKTVSSASSAVSSSMSNFQSDPTGAAKSMKTMAASFKTVAGKVTHG